MRADLNDALDRIVPESERYRHADEGPDDMPAHVKCSLMGAGLTLPIRKGRARAEARCRLARSRHVARAHPVHT